MAKTDYGLSIKFPNFPETMKRTKYFIFYFFIIFFSPSVVRVTSEQSVDRKSSDFFRKSRSCIILKESGAEDFEGL